MISLKMFVKLDDFLKYGVKKQIFQTPRRITPSLSSQLPCSKRSRNKLTRTECFFSNSTFFAAVLGHYVSQPLFDIYHPSAAICNMLNHTAFRTNMLMYVADFRSQYSSKLITFYRDLYESVEAHGRLSFSMAPIFSSFSASFCNRLNLNAEFSSLRKTPFFSNVAFQLLYILILSYTIMEHN